MLLAVGGLGPPRSGDLALRWPAEVSRASGVGWSKSLTTRSAEPISSGGGRCGRLGTATTTCQPRCRPRAVRRILDCCAALCIDLEPSSRLQVDLQC